MGITCWRQGSRESAYLHLERAVEEVFILGESERGRHFAAGLAHTLTYFVAILEDGVPPPEDASGGAFSEPHPSYFVGTNSGMAATWRLRQGPSILRWLVARLALGVGAEGVGKEWMDDAWEGALEQQIPVLLLMLAPHAIVSALATSDWRRGVDAALASGRARVFSDEANRRGETIFDETSSFDSLVQPQQLEDRIKSEEASLWQLSRAIVYALGSRMDTSRGPFRSDLIELAKTVDGVATGAELDCAWGALADTLRLATDDMVTDDECLECLRRGTDEPAWEAVQFVAHGLLGLRSDCRLAQAAGSQVGTVQHALRDGAMFGSSTDDYLIAVSEFWGSAIEQSAFQFTSPRDVKESIQTAKSRPPAERARLTLRAVGIGLRIRFDDETQSWLSSG